MSLLSPESLERLKSGKNLLAFSAGTDSSALFFLLHEAAIDFDIALVNYHTRPNSDREAKAAQEIAKKYNKICYIQDASLPASNFEHEARHVRYAFFEEIIRQNAYDNLITAHHMNDRLEWFLMQLTKGAGLVEMLGFDEIEVREGYALVRPLIHTPKTALLSYLHEKKIACFTDESNSDPRYRRNYFRKRFADPLMGEFHEGIQKSFRYLQKDKEQLFTPEVIRKIEALHILRRTGDTPRDLRQIDRVLKQMGYLLSYAQKEEIMQKGDVVISDRFAVVLHTEKIYIAPYLRTTMPKYFKEACRQAKIPQKIRPYLYSLGVDPSEI